MADVFHKEYGVLSDETKAFIKQIKEKAEELEQLFNKRPGCDPSSIFPDSRESALAKTKLEESVMWFVKGICKVFAREEAK